MQKSKHLLHGNPLIIEKTQLDVDVSKLKLLKQSYLSEIYRLEDMIAKYYPNRIKQLENNIANLTCAVINPKSPNIEQAIKVLEAVAENPEDMINGNPFLLKDKSLYGEKYYSNTRAFEDIYSIASECVLMNSGIGSSFPDIDEYQNGRATLDEAIAMYQREVEMWLNE